MAVGCGSSYHINGRSAANCLQHTQELTPGTWCRHNQPDRDRGYHYLHSTFCDLIITGLVGLRPDEEDLDTLVVSPLVPPDQPLQWFALDNVHFRGYEVSVGWDQQGTVLRTGQGMVVIVNGCIAARLDQLARVEVSLSTCKEI